MEYDRIKAGEIEMFRKILDLIQKKVRYRQYIVTNHARKEMNCDDLDISIYDLERCILNGKIIERQKDKETMEWKYKILGKMINGIEIETIVKIGPTDKLIIITVYPLS